MTNSKTLIDRKTKVVCKFKPRHGGAWVQLPTAGTGPASASATGARWAGDGMVLYVSTDPRARRGLWHRATNSICRGVLVLPPGLQKNAGWSRGQLAGLMPRRSQVQILPLQSSRREALGTRETRIVHIMGNNRSQTGVKIVCVTRLGQLGNINAATVTFMGINSHGTEVRFLPEASGQTPGITINWFIMVQPSAPGC